MASFWYCFSPELARCVLLGRETILVQSDAYQELTAGVSNASLNICLSLIDGLSTIWSNQEATLRRTSSPRLEARFLRSSAALFSALWSIGVTFNRCSFYSGNKDSSTILKGLFMELSVKARNHPLTRSRPASCLEVHGRSGYLSLGFHVQVFGGLE